MKIKSIYFGIFNFLILILISSNNILLAATAKDQNDKLKNEVGLQIKEVLDVWITISAASMVLGIIAGAALMIFSGTNLRMRTAGKTLVLGSGITITLLLSTYVITGLFLKLFGIPLF